MLLSYLERLPRPGNPPEVVPLDGILVRATMELDRSPAGFSDPSPASRLPFALALLALLALVGHVNGDVLLAAHRYSS